MSKAISRTNLMIPKTNLSCRTPNSVKKLTLQLSRIKGIPKRKLIPHKVA